MIQDEMTRRTVLIGGAAALSSLAAFRVAGGASAGATKAEAYRAIRYARSERFGQAIAVPFSEGLIQQERGPISPQLPIFEEVMGPQALNRQDENCQVLSVFTPSRAGKRPVLVFIHGGAFLIGGGELPWYDGDRLAGEHDIVVVNVSYRLGASGYWLPPDSIGLSPGTSDQMAALKWIQDNIAKFGGDPSNVTVSGESAGAMSAVLLTEWGYGNRLFKRIGVMSGGGRARNRFNLEATSRDFDKALGQDPRTASMDAILQAQQRIGIFAWGPVAADNPAPINVDVLAGWTREDASIFVMMEEGKKPMPGTPMHRFRDSARQREVIHDTKARAHQAAATGRKAYLYSFDWNGPDTGLGTVHTIDLAFLLGDRAAWAKAPMLAGADWNDVERLGRLWRAQWAAFVRCGDPNTDPELKWSPVTANTTPVASIA